MTERVIKAKDVQPGDIVNHLVHGQCRVERVHKNSEWVDMLLWPLTEPTNYADHAVWVMYAPDFELAP